MNCRERVLRAIKFGNPDLVPVNYHLSPGALLKYGQNLIELCKKYPSDFYDVNTIKIPERDSLHYKEDGSYYKEITDEWGCTWVYYQEGISGEVKKSPLDDWSKLKSYKFPPVPNSSPEEREQLKEGIRKQKENFIGWGSAGSLFEQMQWLRGVENLLMDIASGREEVYVLADMLLEKYLMPNIQVAIESGADVIGFADDWGCQDRLLINPESWRQIFKPRYKKMFTLAHQAGVLTWLHSDGMILEIIPDFIEIGLDVINPQFSCMDLVKLKEITENKICIYSDIDRQRLLPFGTKEEIREYIKNIFNLFAKPEGGFIYGAGIYPDTPFENISALFHAFYEFR